MAQRRVELHGTADITEYVADFRALLQWGTFPDWKALIRNFVQGIEVVDDAATLTYTVPMPADGVTSEGPRFSILSSQVPLAGLEPATHGLGNRCSIQLSYRELVEHGATHLRMASATPTAPRKKVQPSHRLHLSLL